MKKLLIITLSMVAAVFLAVPAGFGHAAGEAAEDQSGDLCGGTGGNGQIVGIGNDAFTIKPNDDGSNQIIHLASQATIETSIGFVSLSDLKIGDRVTLVGGPNPDGSFTADAIVVCAVTATGVSSVRNEGADLNNIDAAINLSKGLLFVLIWFGIIAFLRIRVKKSFVYLLFFTIFYIYIYKVLDYTLFQFQLLVFEKYFIPDLILRGIAAGESLNLVPLVTLTLEDAKTSFLNILLLMPFGFGLPFITNLRMKRVALNGMIFSIIIESLQFITGLIGKITFRIADINDVIFNTVGAIIGYILFVIFVRIYRRVSCDWKISGNPISRYIAQRPQV